jgi:putative transposase
VLEYEVREGFEEVIQEKADDLELEILELAICPSHVHGDELSGI